MGWEMRHGGRRYLYRNRRVNGKPVKEYLAADDRFGFGDEMADNLGQVLRLEGELRRLKREKRAGFRRRIDDLLGTTAAGRLTFTLCGRHSARCFRRPAPHRGRHKPRCGIPTSNSR